MHMKILSILFLLPTTICAALAAQGRASESTGERAPKRYFGGAGVGRLTLDSKTATQWQCQYDMVLCERIQGRPKTQSGLFVPDADLPKLHICKGTLVR
jgi:hypothetical protein